MYMQVTNPLLLFRRLKIHHKFRGSYAFILEEGAVTNKYLFSSCRYTFLSSNPAFYIYYTFYLGNIFLLSFLHILFSYTIFYFSFPPFSHFSSWLTLANITLSCWGGRGRGAFTNLQSTVGIGTLCIFGHLLALTWDWRVRSVVRCL